MIRRLISNRAAALGGAFLLLLLLSAILAPFISPYDPNAQDLLNNLRPPSSTHLAGTDKFGRDMFSRLIWGSRVSLKVGALSVSIGALIGIPLGLLAACSRQWVDSAISRLLDVMLAFPSLVLSIVVVAMVGTHLTSLGLAIGLSLAPRFARIARSEALQLREEDYVLAARAIGASGTRVAVVHILPQTVSSLIIQATFSFVNAIMAEAALSFLGLGVQPPTPAWGYMVRDGLSRMQSAWWLSIFPGLSIMLTVMAMNMIGDGIRDATDPVLRRVGGRTA